MAGYYNFSMSNNARAAYAAGSMPLSKWTKAAILAAIEDYFSTDPERLELLMPHLRRLKLSTLKAHLLESREWHHTSSHYNKTHFYSLNEWRLEELTPDWIADWLATEETEKKTPQPARKLGTIGYLEWSGTRKHPKATEMMLEDVQIEEKGCFFLVFKGGKQILRKKIGSNGTWVRYAD